MSLTPYEPAEHAPDVTHVDPTGGRLIAWADALGAAHRIGKALCATSFAPAHFRGKPEDAAAAIMFGDEIGLSPTQALRAVYVISGTPSLYARQMAAVVMHHGHEVWTVEKSDHKVTVSGRRRGSQHVITETWTADRARKAGYTNNKKYSTDPQAMLYARALSDVCRQVAPDALAGLANTVEEMELQEQPTTPVQRQPERKTTARRAQPTPPPADEPDLDEPTPNVVHHDDQEDDVPTADTSESDESWTVTKPQITKVNILLRSLGHRDRDDALAHLSGLLGRDVDSSKHLTVDEASAVIDEMERDVAALTGADQ